MRKSRLKAIQQLASRDEQQLVEEVRQAKQNIREEQARVDELFNLLKGYSPATGSSGDAHIFKSLQRFRTGLNKASEVQKAALALADTRLQGARERWIRSHVKRKGIEAIEEKRKIAAIIEEKRSARREATDKFQPNPNPWSMLNKRVNGDK